MTVAGVDPGYRETAVVGFDGERVVYHVTIPNDDLLVALLDHRGQLFVGADILVIEQMQLFTSNYGVGQEIFDSVFWSGRFAQAWYPKGFGRLLRSKIRGHLGASKGGDAAVRASLIARFGPYKETAIGTTKNKGPLHGIKGHEWQALAVAVVWHDLHSGDPETIRPGIQPEF